MNNYIDDYCIRTLKVLGAEIITKAKSGHPGIVLGAAPIAHTLFTRHLNIDANDEKWFNRDRFVLSAGHGSALLYMMLHFAGYDISMDDIKAFRQVGSLTPGHPEVNHTNNGTEIIRNFVYNVCGCSGTWKMSSFAEETVKAIREKIGDKK